MKWMRERDLLIAQTMAFVQSVTGKKPEAEKTLALPANLDAVDPSAPADAGGWVPDLAAMLAETTTVVVPAVTPAKPVQIARLDLQADVKSEIKARVANFRAHQERFSREREAYCTATMAKVHASLKDGTPLPRIGK